VTKNEPPEDEGPLEMVKKVETPAMLLSEFFPRKLLCVYNRFKENLMLKRDMTSNLKTITQSLSATWAAVSPAIN
jgi:hypothetical protein